jgi:hypothetical protein
VAVDRHTPGRQVRIRDWSKLSCTCSGSPAARRQTVCRWIAVLLSSPGLPQTIGSGRGGGQIRGRSLGRSRACEWGRERACGSSGPGGAIDAAHRCWGVVAHGGVAGAESDADRLAEHADGLARGVGMTLGLLRRASCRALTSAGAAQPANAALTRHGRSRCGQEATYKTCR